MKCQRRWLVAAVVAGSVVLAGCATSRSEIRIGGPESVARAPAGAVGGKIVVIRSITDDRVFEEAPADPSTPSLGFGGADAAPATLKSRAIGRKRNSYGKALGDVLLEDGRTVEDVVRVNLAAALHEAGYTVQEQADAGTEATVLDVRIKQFWAWFQPGFWAIKLHTKIATDISAGGVATPISVAIHAEDSRQMATENAWIEIVEQALGQYRAAASDQTRGRL